MKGSSKGSIYSANEARDIDWWTQSDESQDSSHPEEESDSCMLRESKVLCQRCEVHQEGDGWTQGRFKNVQRRHRQGGGVNTHNRQQTLNILENFREDEAEEPTCVFDMSDSGKWVREAVSDSGGVKCVTSKKRMPRRLDFAFASMPFVKLRKICCCVCVCVFLPVRLAKTQSSSSSSSFLSLSLPRLLRSPPPLLFHSYTPPPPKHFSTVLILCVTSHDELQRAARHLCRTTTAGGRLRIPWRHEQRSLTVAP